MGRVLASDFKPAWWLPGPHLQTMWATLVGHAAGLDTRRERLELNDGDFLDLDWVDAAGAKTPTVIVLHGLQGSIHSPYVRGIMNAVQNMGWRGVLMHFRGCSEEPNRLERGYHSGDTSDVATLTSILAQRYPQSPLFIVGFSLGGNILLKWLGEAAGRHPEMIKGAVAVSVPFVLERAAERISRGFSKVYQSHLLRSVKALFLAKLEAGSVPDEYSKFKKVKNLMQLDAEFTVPLHGFSALDEYYAHCSSRRYLDKIQIPTLILHAQNDPFMTRDVIPGEHEMSAQVTLELSRCGGHLGFVAGHVPGKADYWLEKRIPLFLQHQYAIA